MLALTKKVEYALIAACDLARAHPRVVSAREIAARNHLRPALLMNVVKALSGKGLLRSVRGVRGGYTLAKAPEELTLASLIRATEGPLRLVRCAADGGVIEPDCCELLHTCPVRQPLARVHGFLERFVEGVTVSDLAFDEFYAARPAAAPLRVLAQ